MKGGSKVIVEAHRHEGIFIAKGKENALVTKNLIPGEAVYNEKRVSVQVISFSLLPVYGLNLFRTSYLSIYMLSKIHLYMFECLKVIISSIFVLLQFNLTFCKHCCIICLTYFSHTMMLSFLLDFTTTMSVQSFQNIFLCMLLIVPTQLIVPICYEKLVTCTFCRMRMVQRLSIEFGTISALSWQLLFLVVLTTYGL
jgi:hypothetical protein